MRTSDSIIPLLLAVFVPACAFDAESGGSRPLEADRPRTALAPEPGAATLAEIPAGPVTDVTAGGESVGIATDELKKERNGTTLFNDATRLADANRTLRGYAASVKLGGGCSGAMIGPNIFMTAAHCAGSSDQEIRFYVSRGGRYDGWKSETFTCQMLFRTFNDTDLMLYHCPAKDGVNPGDKYGHLDFETAHGTSRHLDVPNSSTLAVVDTPVRVFWWNDLEKDTDGNAVDVSNAIFLSQGKVTSRASSNDWPSIQGGCGLNHATPLFKSNVWVKAGVSGSSSLSFKNRIVGGPTTLATSDSDGDDSLTAVAAIEYFRLANIYTPYGSEDCNDNRKQLNKGNLEDLGLVSDDYIGSVDKNQDGVFDVQAAIERRPALQTTLPQVWEGFESQRRAIQWDLFGLPKFFTHTSDENYGYVQLAAGEKVEKQIRIAGGGKLYRLLTLVQTTAAAQVEVCYTSGIPSCSTWNLGTGNFQLGRDAQGAGDFGRVSIRVVPGSLGNVRVSAVAAVAISEWHTFATHDSRMLWRKADNKNGLFLPLGENGGDTIDFALTVEKGNPVWSDYIPVTTGKRVCFSSKQDDKVDSASGVGYIEVAGARWHFTPTSSWVHGCTGPVTIPAGTVPRVTFVNNNMSHLIDNMRISN